MISEIRGAYESGAMETFPSFNPVQAPYGLSSLSDRPELKPTQLKSNHQPMIFYIAGGGFILPPSKRQKTTIQQMADFTNLKIIMGNYRLAPENPFPLPIDDIVSQYQALVEKHPENEIFLMADTAGASIAMGVVQVLASKKQALPSGIILFSPWCDLSLSGWSYIANSMTAQSPFRMESAAFCARLYLQETSPTNPLASAIFADLSDFPPILIHTSENDLHFDDAIRLAENGKQQGCDVKLNYWDSPRHHLERLSSEDAKAAFSEVSNFVDRLSGKMI
jgi:acetyl esterase/lipase